MAKYIDADALLKHRRKMQGFGLSFEDSFYDYAVLVEDIQNAPAADVAEVVHGHWVNPHWKNSDYCCDCSVCKGEAMHREFRWNDKGIYPICPNCGARMHENGW